MQLKGAGISAGKLLALLPALCLAVAALAARAADDDDDAAATQPLLILGYVENAQIGRLQLDMTAKLDTGAATSSVHALDVEVYTKGDNDHWVRFRLTGKEGRTVRYDQNVIRFVNIKADSGGYDRRPVIRIPLCVAGVLARAEVNLADREDLNYDLLIGREFMATRIAVDSGRAFLSEPDCGSGEND